MNVFQAAFCFVFSCCPPPAYSIKLPMSKGNKKWYPETWINTFFYTVIAMKFDYLISSRDLNQYKNCLWHSGVFFWAALIKPKGISVILMIFVIRSVGEPYVIWLLLWWKAPMSLEELNYLSVVLKAEMQNPCKRQKKNKILIKYKGIIKPLTSGKERSAV